MIYKIKALGGNYVNIIVIGLGSMGRRRIRLLRNIDENFNIIGIDIKTERRELVENEFNIKCYTNIESAVKDYKFNMAFVCSSPISHSNIILKCLSYNMNVFTELNLNDDKYDEIINIAKSKNLVLFLSSTMIYREEINYINSKVKLCSNKVNYIYHVGQYLPDWHPWEDYTEFFVADKRSNGCRELFAIELPWIIKTFGKIKNISVVKDKISNLKVNYNDSYIVILEHENGHKGVLNVDIVSRKPVRNLEVFGEEIYLFWDGTPFGLKEMNLITKEMENIKVYSDIKKDQRYSDNIIENAYAEEVKKFISEIKGENKALYSFEDDKYILKIIDKIEE